MDLVEVSHANKKEKYISIDELRNGVCKENFENVIVSDRYLIQFHVIQDGLWTFTLKWLTKWLLNYIHFLQTGN